MERHILRLRYDGLSAERGEIGTSASKQIISGSQMLLGANAHYFLNHQVPHRINDRGVGYEIMDYGRQRGSYIADFVIAIAASGVYDVLRYNFGSFFQDSYTAWAEGRIFENPPYERLEPYFEVRGANAPFVDDYDNNHRQRVRLSNRIGKAMSQITAPNGVFSSVLEMSFDGQLFATLTRRFYDEDDIADAVRMFRDSKTRNPRVV